MSALRKQAVDVIEAFHALSISEQQQFFATVGKRLDFPAVVRHVAKGAADELADYMEFHGVHRAEAA